MDLIGSHIRRPLDFIRNSFSRLVAMIDRQTAGRQQRMCPFCGLITARYKTSCLECGKVLQRT